MNHEFFDYMGIARGYKNVEILGNKLSVMTKFIDWEPFRPLLDDMCSNKTEVGGRPNFDVKIFMSKVLLL